MTSTRLVVGLVLLAHAAVFVLSVLLWNPRPAPQEDRAVTFLDLRMPPPPAVAPPVPPAVRQPPAAVVPVPAPSPEPTPVPSDPAPAPGPVVPGPGPAPAPAEPDYLPQFKIDQVPQLPEKALRDRIVYPPLAVRQGIEAVVPLYLYIDTAGVIRKVEVIKDPGFGFAEAARKALEGLTVEPARSQGLAVAVKFRYAVRFQLK